jgi:hypothetical protein
MFEPEVEYTYWPPEPPVPYEPYRGYTTDPSRSRQQSFATQSAAPISQAGIARTSPARPAMPARSEQKKPVTPRMSKAEALEVVDQCKRWLVAGSIVAFGVISGLVAGHVIGSSSQAANQSNNQDAPSFNSPSNSPSNNGGFFQQGGNNFGNGNSGQSPSSGSHTS